MDTWTRSREAATLRTGCPGHRSGLSSHNLEKFFESGLFDRVRKGDFVDETVHESVVAVHYEIKTAPLEVL